MKVRHLYLAVGRHDDFALKPPRGQPEVLRAAEAQHQRVTAGAEGPDEAARTCQYLGEYPGSDRGAEVRRTARRAVPCQDVWGGAVGRGGHLVKEVRSPGVEAALRRERCW